MVSAPLLYIQEKCSADREVTCQGQTSLEAEPGPGPPHSAQHVPSCQPASSSGPSLRPEGEDVDQILCPLTVFALPPTVFALPPTGLPAPPLAPPVSGSWNLSPLNRRQWSLVSPSHLGALRPPICSHSILNKGSVSAKSESVSSPSAPSEAGMFPPWLLPKPQTQVLLSSRRGLDLAFPRTLESTFFLGRSGRRAWVGQREDKNTY